MVLCPSYISRIKSFWQLLIKNMSLWESEKSWWHTKKGLFCATVCPSYLRFPVVSSPDIPRRPPSHQCPTQRKRLELIFSFKFYAIGKGREYDIFQVQLSKSKTLLLAYWSLFAPPLSKTVLKKDVKAKEAFRTLYFRKYFFEAMGENTFELENFRASQLEIRRTSPFPCSPNLLHVLQSGIAGFHNLWSPAWVWSKSRTFCLKTSDMKVYSLMPSSKA